MFLYLYFVFVMAKHAPLNKMACWCIRRVHRIMVAALSISARASRAIIGITASTASSLAKLLSSLLSTGHAPTTRQREDLHSRKLLVFSKQFNLTLTPSWLLKDNLEQPSQIPLYNFLQNLSVRKNQLLLL